MASSLKDDSGAITEINVTPLVDIILVVLIIFMATAPMIQRRALKVDVPKAAQHEKAATEALAITFSEKRELTLSGQPISLGDLEAKLSRVVATQPNVHVTLAADKAIPYGEVVAIVDSVRASGVKKIGLEVGSKR